MQHSSLPDDVTAIVRDLGLEPHPEGGWFRRIWWSERLHRPGRERAAGSAIHYLLGDGDVSAWHRVRDAEELWHHLAGGPLELSTSPDGVSEHKVLLSGDQATGASTHHAVPQNHWQSARALSGPVLVLCVVAPAFMDHSFEMAPACWEPGGDQV
jgi:uncharacterized protein